MKQEPPDATAIRREFGLFNDHEVAALIGCSLLTLRNRRSMGDAPPSAKIGREHVTTAKDLSTWIARKRRSHERVPA